MTKQAFFNTLNEALDSESLIEYWPLGLNIGYNETATTVSNGSKRLIK